MDKSVMPAVFLMGLLVAGLLLVFTLDPIASSRAGLDGWSLAWQDEFDGDEINRDNWTFDIGATGWGNNEWQHYTDRPENARIEDGMLVIEAREESYRGSDYTSARLKSQGLQRWQYGRIEARVQLPGGQGIWPAVWMLGDDFSEAGWPRSGEIDIMEFLGHDVTTVYGTVHGPRYSGSGGIGGSYTIEGADLTEGFHIFAVEWTPHGIEWLLDDEPFFTLRPDEVPGEWVFDKPFFLIMNVAVGGAWPGYPDETTTFPQQLRIDYVRVYQQAAYPTPAPADLPPSPAETTPVHLAGLTIESDAAGRLTVYATVLDAQDQPVTGVAVSATWIGADQDGATTFSTDVNGVAGPFMTVPGSDGGSAAFCVTGIAGEGYRYDTLVSVEPCISSGDGE